MPQMYCTVIPVHNVSIKKPPVEFADGFVFTTLPRWISRDKWLRKLNKKDQAAIGTCVNAFVAAYEAESLGDPEPRWKGTDAKGKQQVKYEVAVMANLALWLAKPTPAGFRQVFHCIGGTSGWNIQQSYNSSILLCHPNDEEARLNVSDIQSAAALHASLATLHIEHSFWSPALITWSGLQQNSELVRYLLAWVALESLFGPDDARELSFRLAQRIGFFVGANRSEAREISKQATACYKIRSKVAHGRWTYKPETTERMYETEQMLRSTLLKILGDPELTSRFTGTEREEYLDSLVFQN